MKRKKKIVNFHYRSGDNSEYPHVITFRKLLSLLTYGAVLISSLVSFFSGFKIMFKILCFSLKMCLFVVIFCLKVLRIF